MSETSQVWDGISVGDAAAVAPYSASEWAARQKLLQGQGTVFPNYGVLHGTGDGTYSPLQVQAKSPASTQIEVEAGSALVNGYLYQNTAALSFTIGANASGNPRVDTVILRVDFVGQTVRLVVKQGTPAGSPVAPTMQQDATYWEIPLADIAVANGFATLPQSTITNRQRGVKSIGAGWQPYAYPLNYVINGAYNARSYTLAAGTSSALAVPVFINANFLLQDIVFYNGSGASGITAINWGFYIEDVNDGNTAENTLRLVASGSATINQVSGGNVTITASPAPQILTPGLYWFVLQNASTNPILVGSLAASTLDTTPFIFRNTGLSSIPQTLDMVTGWSTNTDKLGIYFRGRVFGKTAVL